MFVNESDIDGRHSIWVRQAISIEDWQFDVYNWKHKSAKHELERGRILEKLNSRCNKLSFKPNKMSNEH